VSGRDERIAELERQVEELRRVNERLGSELVEAEAGRRPTLAAPAAQSVAKLVGERDRAGAELERLIPELERLRPENERLRSEIERLRRGYPGLFRRARARLRRR
jgi:phage shock protein A